MLPSLTPPALLRTIAVPRGGTTHAPVAEAELPQVRPIRVLLIDPQVLSRRAARDALAEDRRLEVVGEVGSAAAALAIAGDVQPDIVILDTRLSDTTGVALTRRLIAALPAVRVVLLSVSHSDEAILEALRAGAYGYLPSDIQPDALARAITGVAAGEVAMSRRIAARLVERFRESSVVDAESLPELTGREVDVLRLLSDGATDREIAGRLVIAESTAKKHVQHILRKLRARNRAEAVAKYQRYCR